MDFWDGVAEGIKTQAKMVDDLVTGRAFENLIIPSEYDRNKNEKEVEMEAERKERMGVPVHILKENDAGVHAIMAATLPKLVIIQSNHNNKYLHFFEENQTYPDALRYDGDYSFGLETRFEVEPAKTGTGLVHIRSLQNNKYWANYGTPNNWVSAMAIKPEENQSDKSCTLFQPVFKHPNNIRVLKLRHVYTGNYVSFFQGNGHTQGLLAIKNVDDNSDECTFIDWKSVVKFPERIRIQGKSRKYLKAFKDGFMDFKHEVDNSKAFDFEVYPSRDGGIRLKSSFFGTYWTDTCNPWIKLAEASATVHEINTVFLPTIVGPGEKGKELEEKLKKKEEDEGKSKKGKKIIKKKEPEHRILIRSLRSGLFCKMFSADGMTGCLACTHDYADQDCYMEIDEPIVSRKIHNVRYCTKDIRRYNEKTSALITDDSINKTKYAFKSSLHLKTTVVNTAVWSTGVTNTLGKKISLSATIPKVGELGYGNTTKEDDSWNWEETEEEEKEVGFVTTIDVPKMSRVKAYTMGTRLSYDIPFSYTQTDVLSFTGTPETLEKTDGIFTGHDGYGYDYDNISLPLE